MNKCKGLAKLLALVVTALIMAQFAGAVTFNGYSMPTATNNPGNIVIGSDGNLLFTEQNGNTTGRAVEVDHALAMLVPSSQQFFTIDPPVQVPVIDVDPSLAKPIGLGLVASHGNLVSLEVALAPILGHVDIYFALLAPSINPNILFLTSAGLLTTNIVPWISDTTGDIFITLLQDFPTSGLPPGTYSFYLAVTPTGAVNDYYIWVTSFAH